MSAARALRVVVATPSHDGRCSMFHAQTLLDGRESCAARGVAFDRVVGRSAHLAQLRNRLAAAALEEDATHVLWLDEDIAIMDADAVGKMLDIMERAELGLLALAVLRRPAFGHDSGLAHPAENPTGPAEDHIGCASALLSIQGGLTRLRMPLPPGVMRPPPGSWLALGAGCLMVRADVHCALPNGFEWGDLASEDWTFTTRAQVAGFAAGLETTIPTMHYGPTGWIHRGALASEPRQQEPLWRAFREVDALARYGERESAARRLETMADGIREGA